MWPVISSKTDDYEKKWIKSDSLVSWWEVQEEIVDIDKNKQQDEFRKKHLWDYNVKLKHILAYLRDWVPFWDDIDEKDLFANMIAYNSKIRRAISKADDYNDTENDRKAV